MNGDTQLETTMQAKIKDRDGKVVFFAVAKTIRGLNAKQRAEMAAVREALAAGQGRIPAEARMNATRNVAVCM